MLENPTFQGVVALDVPRSGECHHSNFVSPIWCATEHRHLWQLCVVEGIFSPCLHHSHLLRHMWDTASRRNRRLGEAITASQWYLTWKKIQNKPTNLFFYMLEVILCLLVKPVRKKFEILCLIEKKKSINSILQMIACMVSSQNPTVSQFTSSSKLWSLHFHQENAVLPSPAVAWMASDMIICTGNFIAKKL